MDKQKLKKALMSASTPEEQNEILKVDALVESKEVYKKFEKNMESVQSNIERLTSAISNNAKSGQIDAIVSALSRNITSLQSNMEMMQLKQKEQAEIMAKAMTSVVSEMKDEMVGSIGRVRSVLENQNAGPLYKTMINALSGVKESIDKKPVPVWNWPQYASVGVRDKSFSNIDPSLAYQHNTTTPSVPYGTSLAFDSSGTIKVVSSSNKLPVDASVTIASTSLAGLATNLKELDGNTIDTNSGNKSAGTLRVTLATDQIQLTNALKVDGSAVTQPVSATNLDIRDLVFATDKVDASGSTLGSNSGVDIGDVTINNASGGSAVNIQDGGNTITVDGAITAVGTVADDGITPGSPVMTGGSSKNFDGTSPGNVSAEDDVVRFITDPNRRLYVNNVHPQFWSFHTDKTVGLTNITDKSIQATPGSNNSIFVTDIAFSCSSVVAGVELFFEEGSTTVLGPYFLDGSVAGRGMHLSFKTPKQITANTALTMSTVQAGTQVQYSVDVTGFVSRVN